MNTLDCKRHFGNSKRITIMFHFVIPGGSNPSMNLLLWRRTKADSSQLKPDSE